MHKKKFSPRTTKNFINLTKFLIVAMNAFAILAKDNVVLVKDFFRVVKTTFRRIKYPNYGTFYKSVVKMGFSQVFLKSSSDVTF